MNSDSLVSFNLRSAHEVLLIHELVADLSRKQRLNLGNVIMVVLAHQPLTYGFLKIVLKLIFTKREDVRGKYLSTGG